MNSETIDEMFIMGKVVHFESIKNKFFTISCFFMIAFIILRSAIALLTYDECQTYYAYAKVLSDNHFSIAAFWEVLKFSWANNQWLNTILIALLDSISGVEWNEFVIRMPSIFFGIAYYIMLLLFNKKEKINDLEFVFLCYSYFINEYFSQARGYGMASFLVMFALVLLKQIECSDNKADTEKKDRNVIVICGLLLLSCYANSISLLVCASVGIVILINYKRDIFRLIKKFYPIISFYLLGLAFIIFYHFYISGSEKPLYAMATGNPLFFLAQYCRFVIGDSNDDISKYIVIYNMSSVLLLVLIITVSIILIKKKIFNKGVLFEVFVIHYIFCIIAGLSFARGGIVGRVVIPSYPLFILGLGDGISRLMQIYSIKCNKYEAS